MSDNRILPVDLSDSEFVDAVELASDGYYVYRTVSLVSTTSSTKEVVISTPTIVDRLNNVDQPLQIGDRVYIFNNAAIGYYTVAAIVDPTSTFSVVESIVDSIGGDGYFIHPAGALKVGVDNTNLSFTNKNTVQEALEDLDGYLNAIPPNGVGQVLFAISPTKFSVAMPVTSNQGWLINDDGILLVNQVYEDDP